ncbi:hypothetical protein A1Q1_02927 [Trichosporon asahii var. asahii CBS 2479]|uniref:Uncharacterized protein n=1 Tax=Trichosporon asahii var. asahii (strain ATCC 90039 / CBS 2479 / JCM 2466 / KCTC 7840 / NBRC 103889/ NCYC 2677 / UAMH 7654) TaxID=1186058 RepID=J6EU50_TRIAS|nr:hypothetical protein A1Q1_02927 [Trichosporon asahii var. asahii CBS 2479]EJT48089.1 hypothetical protein A1Q1_02927 [Trichosporon asahii var. asahii CBS 2479]
MSKLSPELKALIADPAAKGGDVPAPSPEVTQALFGRLSSNPHIGRETWLCLAAAVLLTINSSETLCLLYDFAKGETVKDQVYVASSINNLGALYSHLSYAVRDGLESDAARTGLSKAEGLELWKDIYGVHADTLIEKLSAFHPDLAEYILASHYGPLLTDPPAEPGQFRLGRVLTSVIAIAALRAVTGVGLQVTSHVYGLKAAKDDGTVKGCKWLQSDEGCMWILRTTDDIVNTVLRS